MQQEPADRTREQARLIARREWPETETDDDFCALELSAESSLHFRWRAWQAIKGIGKAARARRRFAIVAREERDAATSGLRRGSDDAAEETTLDAVDRVLDKISAEGMASLTEQEKQLLDQVSKKHRTN